MQFHEKLQSLRRRYSVSQTELAEAVGVSRKSIQYYESGERYPRGGVLAKLAEFFNVCFVVFVHHSSFSSCFPSNIAFAFKVHNMIAKTCFNNFNVAGFSAVCIYPIAERPSVLIISYLFVQTTIISS